MSLSDPPPYFERLAAAFVRGALATQPPAPPDGWLFTRPLDDLSPAEVTQLIAIGRASGLRLHKFKRTMELPRVRRVLGTLKGLAPAALLDIGSGRGTFLWPLVDTFPDLPIQAIDRHPRRVADIQAIRRGGILKARGCSRATTTCRASPSASSRGATSWSRRRWMGRTRP